MISRVTWGSALVTGLAGFAIGLLVAALVIAGRPAPRPVEFGDSQTPPATSAQPVTVSVPGAARPPRTVTEQETPPPTTTTRFVEVPPLTTPTPTPPPPQPTFPTSTTLTVPPESRS